MDYEDIGPAMAHSALEKSIADLMRRVVELEKTVAHLRALTILDVLDEREANADAVKDRVHPGG